MPYSKAHKQQTRERILESALHLFTHQGFEQTSIDQVMAHAQLTRGAFYAHFASKQDLYAQAIASAPLFSIFNQFQPGEADTEQWLEKAVNGYLSLAHVQKQPIPCPLAFMVTDVALQEPEARQAYTEVFLGLNRIMRRYSKGRDGVDRERLMAVTAMMIGGVAVARTLDDGAAQKLLLKSCRRTALELLRGDDTVQTRVP